MSKQRMVGEPGEIGVHDGGRRAGEEVRLRAERDALAERVAQLEALLALLDAPVALIDPRTGDIDYLNNNPAHCPSDPGSPAPWGHGCGTAAERSFKAACEAALKDLGSTIDSDVVQVLESPNGTRRRFATRVVAYRSPTTGRRALLALARDVTPLRQYDARFKLLLEQLPTVVWATDENLRVLTAEGQVLEHVGLFADDAAGIALDHFLEKRGAPRSVLLALREALRGRASRLEVSWGDRSYEIYVEPLRAPRSEEGIVGTLGLALDVTERRSLREQVRQVQKIDALGRLVGEVAHDFNNLLTAILGHATVARRQLPDGHPARDSLAEIRRAGERAADLTRQLLAFSRRQVLRPVSLDPGQVVERVVRMLGRVLGEHIEVRLEREEVVPTIFADEGQLEQVLVNLAVNARDAMPDGGILTFRCGARQVGELDALHLALRPGRYAVIHVSDTGIGMDADTMAHIFEPFYTTKEHGTGLGLATAYGIVAQSGGRLEVESVRSEGTTFRIYLPASEQRVRKTVEHSSEGFLEPTVAAKDARVLLVEDEEAVRRLASTLLREAGYEVVEAIDGARALQIVEETGEVDLLVSDVLMPRLDGPTLAQRLRQRWPSLPVVFVSGHPAERWPDVEAFGASSVLAKPFSPVELLRAVRRALAPGDG